MQNDENSPLVQPPDESSSRWTWERKVIVGLNCYNVFMWSVYYTVIVPLLPIFAKKYGFDEFMQGVVLASLQIGWFLGLPFVNKAFLKPRTMVYIGAVAYTLAPAVVAVHPALWTILLGRIIEGFGSCLLLVLMTSVLARELPEDIRGFAFGLRSFIGGFGILLGPVVGGVLYPLGGLHLIMTILTVMAALGLVAYLVCMKEQWFASYETRIAEAEAAGIGVLARFRALLQENTLNWLLSLHLFSWVFMGTMFMAVPHFMVNEMKLNSTSTSFFWAVCDVLKMIGALTSGYVVDILNSWDVFFAALLLQYLAKFVLVALTIQPPTTIWVFLAACCPVFVFGTTEDGILGPAYMKMVTTLESTLSKIREVKDEERFEEIISLMEFICAVALMMGPVYAGSMYPIAGFALTILGLAIPSFILDSGSTYATRVLRSVPSP
eukprot:gnl/TRDRNA2_/TRDRNA2_148581_c3_seq1.p1 gnl/TRDRNA2_/TRDRNA2_148581_c3~~gnl/TRDRNA2_/TRDRNA2_148581_c3_seq1.p1  ORF type:complete len:437 (+),score=50.24 gnl/TRDRNA2_/TRDRNA2_148581_c3_seq1:141-1451(+)